MTNFDVTGEFRATVFASQCHLLDNGSEVYRADVKYGMFLFRKVPRDYFTIGVLMGNFQCRGSLDGFVQVGLDKEVVLCKKIDFKPNET